MYTYSDFTVLIALNYMNKVQTEKKTTTTTTRKQREETGQSPTQLCL